MTAGAGLPLGANTGAAGESAPIVPDADPAPAETFLRTFVEGMPPASAAETPCTSLLCQMDPATDLVLLALYVMVCVVVTMGVIRLATLLRDAIWDVVDFIARRR